LEAAFLFVFFPELNGYRHFLEKMERFFHRGTNCGLKPRPEGRLRRLEASSFMDTPDAAKIRPFPDIALIPVRSSCSVLPRPELDEGSLSKGKDSKGRASVPASTGSARTEIEAVSSSTGSAWTGFLIPSPQIAKNRAEYKTTLLSHF
jgi:hypothetical protein